MSLPSTKPQLCSQFKKYDFLTPEEILLVSEKIHSLKSLWIPRKSVGPFYTLGKAAYLDATGFFERLFSNNTVEYFDGLEKNNSFLYYNFHDFYLSLANKIEKILNGDVEFEKSFALPGFHIFKSCENFKKPLASIHFDNQYMLLDWSGFESPDFENTITFTVPIQLPAEGAGIYAWDIYFKSLEDAKKLTSDPQTFKKLLDDSYKEYIPYELGTIMFHSGRWLHQISPLLGEVSEDDWRITLQGHAIKCGKTWKVYW